jgi:hypothetical protein
VESGKRHDRGAAGGAPPDVAVTRSSRGGLCADQPFLPACSRRTA